MWFTKDPVVSVFSQLWLDKIAFSNGDKSGYNPGKHFEGSISNDSKANNPKVCM